MQQSVGAKQSWSCGWQVQVWVDGLQEVTPQQSTEVPQCWSGGWQQVF
jgi:hypothetical protein